jgi:hypothetical protein
MGECTEPIVDLATLIMEFPLHEGFREGQMHAIRRSVRRHEALAVFRKERVTLVTELGVEPGDRYNGCTPGFSRVIRG